MRVKPKKKYGQHFLYDINIARKIVSYLKFNDYDQAIEIGPGMGILTNFFPTKKTYIIRHKAIINFMNLYLSKLIII